MYTSIEDQMRTTILNSVDGYTICMGNNEKFDPIVKGHKEIFNDPMGKATAYVLLCNVIIVHLLD